MSVLIHYHPCNSKHFFYLYHFAPSANHSVYTSIYPIPKIPNPYSKSCKSLRFSSRLPKFRRARVQFCTKNGVEFKDTLLPQNAAREEESESLELLGKPSLKEVENASVEEREEIEAKVLDKDEVLEPFYRFFKPFGEESVSESEVGTSAVEGREKISVEYYEAKAGDLVVGVVVSGNENKLDVNVGADLLGTMLTKDVLPLSDKEMEHLFCDVEKDGQEFLVPGKMGIVKYDEAMSGQPLPGKPVVEPGTVLFAEVLGRTLGGRSLLSSRKLFRRIAWHRVRQIKQLNEPIEVKITEWNTGGLLTRVEGLRAFLPKAELMNRVNNFTELKENVGRKLRVLITRINQDTNDLILGEREAWEKSNLQEGTLLVGTVKKIFPYGAQIRIGDTNRSGLLHISKISRERIASVSDVLAIDEEVKVLVVKSMFPGKIALSIAELESEPGLFLSNKERLYHEAKEMAMKYRQPISPVSKPQKPEAHPTDEGLPFEEDEKLYSNWKWFKFERDNEQSP